MDDKELSAFGDKARRLNLDIHIETSASDKASIDEAVAIALKTGASSVRFYPRYEGNLRDVLSIIANDIAYVRETYQDSGLTFTIEQHEDLKVMSWCRWSKKVRWSLFPYCLILRT